MHRKQNALRAISTAETDCATCLSGKRCWGELALALDSIRGRRELPLERGALLLKQGERASAVYVVVSGCLILRETLEDGTQRVVGLRLPGELLGMETYARGAHAYTAQAASETTVCRIQLPPAGSGRANVALLERLLLKYAVQPERAAAPWAGLPAAERVAAFIENYAQRAQVGRGTDGLFSLPMTRADIGSYLGLAPETVVRALGQLRGARRLSIQGRTIRLAEAQPASASPAA